MSLRKALMGARYDDDGDGAGAEVIPIKAFDPVECEARIKAASVTVDQLRAEKSDLETRLVEAEKELATARDQMREWCKHLGVIEA